MRFIFSVIFVFLMVFYVKIPVVSNSLVFVFILSLFFSLRENVVYKGACYYFLSKRYIRFVFLFYFIPLFYYAYLTVFNGSYDFSFIGMASKNLFYIFICLFSSLCLFSFLPKEKFQLVMLAVFSIQSCIIIFLFFNNEYIQYVNVFQSDSSVLVSSDERIFGIRGLALSNQQYFGLAVVYCIVFVFIVYESQKMRSAITILPFLCLFLVSGLTIARTVLVGFIISVLLLLVILNFRQRIVLLLSLLLFMSVFASAFSDYLYDHFNHFYSWAFEFFINKGESASTNRLMEMYDKLTLDSSFWGEGRYVNSDGTFYNHVDSGLLRLWFAIGIFSILPSIFTLCIIYEISILYRALGYKYSNSLLVFTSCLVLLLQVKGEVIGHHTGVNVVLILYHVQLKYRIKFNSSEGA
ncbi:conserved membrane hypothetical protein [Vibrio chagasii]|nr:conserved membrane hypothetical protein [Vibrio chagasii]